ncbi:hypothetical protein GN316_08865 [Xylophilus sp. Kf1]|nr:hypothetical protein [Xylophilus sp. Kf1]
MSSDDIANLYRQFGGAPENYKELGRDNVVRQSRERWPLLADVRAQDAARQIASVRAGEAHAHGGPVPTVFDEAAAARAAADARSGGVAPIPPVVARPPVATVTTPVPAARPPVTVPRRHEPTFEPAATIPARAPAVPGTELQGLFSRLARQPEPTAPVADPEGSLLRRLLKP